MVKNPPAKQGMQVQSLGQEDPLEKQWQLTPVCLPGKSHGQRSLEGCGPWGPERVRQDLAIKTTTTDILNFTLLVSSLIGTGSNNFPVTLPKGAITCING